MLKSNVDDVSHCIKRYVLFAYKFITKLSYNIYKSTNDVYLFREDNRNQIDIKVATHSSTLAWQIPWMEEPGRLQSMGSLGVGHD